MRLLRCIVGGKVQGVSYRKSISQACMRMQLQGYVKNLADGTVEVVAVVFDEDYDAFMQILKTGSPLSTVENVAVSEIEECDFSTDGFEIRY